MNNELNTNRIFGERNVVEIIIYLYLFGPKSRSDIYRTISTNPRMPIKLDLLQEYGLLNETVSNPGNRRTASLTNLGKKYAMYLCEMERMLGGNLEMHKWDIIKSGMDDAQDGK